MAKNKTFYCFHCGKEIDGRRYTIGLNIPRGDLSFHYDCFREVRGGDEQGYLESRVKDIYEYAKSWE